MSIDIDNLSRPYPPAELLDEENDEPLFAPCQDLERWVKTHIIGEGQLYNPDHDHLIDARIAFLFTNVPNTRQGRRVIGTCEIPNAHGGTWTKAREEFQLRQWFGDMPNFVITLDALYASECDNAGFCAIVEHELYHAAQAIDRYGAPRFDRKTGEPMYCIRGHDAEEFVGVVRRYGVDAAAAGVKELVAAANEMPTVSRVRIGAACGVCLR